MGPLTKITKLIKFWFHNKFKDLLCLGKEKPKAAPGGKLLLLREVELHLLAGVPGHDGDHHDDNADADTGDDADDDVA